MPETRPFTEAFASRRDSCPVDTLHARIKAWLTLASVTLLVGCGTMQSPSTIAPLAAPATSGSAMVFEPAPAVVDTGEHARTPASRLQSSARSSAPSANAADAVPRVDRISSGAPNLPYSIKGVDYLPLSEDVPMKEVGIASWYGADFHGKPAATGERFDMGGMTAAHPTMPLPSYAIVRNLDNGRQVVVRVNDRGPFFSGRIIDLSLAAARKLGIGGVGRVEVERITHADIRTGAWKIPASDGTPANVAATRSAPGTAAPVTVSQNP
ncbi:hypothetical protein BH09PSE5_BH09PSE5_02710 [soil metagenome]